MYTNTNRNFILAFIKVGLLMSLLIADSAIAAECTSLKIIVNRNIGVTESNNDCKEESNISIGTILRVSAGSRLWLKTDADESGTTSQVICQNRSANAVDVTIESASSPWIKPLGLDNCGGWTSKKLNCAANDVQKGNFFCALATSKPLMIASAPLQKNSVSMRGGGVKSLFKGRKAKEIISEIKPEVKLCKFLYDVTSSVKVVWVVSRYGKVKKINIENGDAELTACIKSIVKPEKYIRSNKEMIYTQIF